MAGRAAKVWRDLTAAGARQFLAGLAVGGLLVGGISTALTHGRTGGAAVAAAAADPASTAGVPAPGPWPRRRHVAASPAPARARAATRPAPAAPAAPAPKPAPKPAAKPAPPVTLRAGGPNGTPGSPLPEGKGMWIWEPERTHDGNAAAIVIDARNIGLTHLYVRTGSTAQGFYAQGFLDQLLPLAHAAGIRVYGWDYIQLLDWRADAQRGLAAIRYTTPAHQRIDGFASDIENWRATPEATFAYGTYLRQGVGYGYPLIAVVPRPSERRRNFPYAHAVAQFDAVAPMVYWLNREPGADVAGAIDNLRQFHKPVLPVGQAYDGAGEGGHPGVPSRAELFRFMGVAAQKGAPEVSFWSWQSADGQAWAAIHDAPWFRRPTVPPVTSAPALRPLVPGI